MHACTRTCVQKKKTPAKFGYKICLSLLSLNTVDLL